MVTRQYEAEDYMGQINVSNTSHKQLRVVEAAEPYVVGTGSVHGCPLVYFSYCRDDTSFIDFPVINR